VPITWRNRRSGISKLKIKEMGSRYLFVALYCWLEKYFSRGDYSKKRQQTAIVEPAPDGANLDAPEPPPR
jgi:dolichol-phosphate mannosyltransferase